MTRSWMWEGGHGMSDYRRVEQEIISCNYSPYIWIPLQIFLSLKSWFLKGIRPFKLETLSSSWVYEESLRSKFYKEKALSESYPGAPHGYLVVCITYSYLERPSPFLILGGKKAITEILIFLRTLSSHLFERPVPEVCISHHPTSQLLERLRSTLYLPLPDNTNKWWESNQRADGTDDGHIRCPITFPCSKKRLHTAC